MRSDEERRRSSAADEAMAANLRRSVVSAGDMFGAINRMPGTRF